MTHPLYLVECSFGRLGNEFIATDRFKNSRAQVVADIASGQIENVLTVLEIFEDENTCRNITDDILGEVAELQRVRELEDA